MHLLRAATLTEVLEAAPEHAPTRSTVTAQQPYELWLFSGDDVGEVQMQLPGEMGASRLGGAQGRIRDRFEPFKSWLMHGAAPEHVQRYAARLSNLVQRESFLTRPIIFGPTMTIADGKHRLVAAWEHARAIPGSAIEVYWGARGR